MPMARANGLMKRLVVFGNAMDDYMEREGGILKVGLYAPRQRQGDIAGRLQQGMDIHEPWMSRVYPNAAMDSGCQRGRYLDGSPAVALSHERGLPRNSQAPPQSEPVRIASGVGRSHDRPRVG
jgi:hypothetical protein